MPYTEKQFEAGCRRLERQGFERTTKQWCDIDESEFEVARVLHPNGSYALYQRKREPSDV